MNIGHLNQVEMTDIFYKNRSPPKSLRWGPPKNMENKSIILPLLPQLRELQLLLFLQPRLQELQP